MPNFIKAVPGLYRSVIYTDDAGKNLGFLEVHELGDITILVTSGRVKK